VDLIEPAQSLMLLKPSTQISHEGGQRFKTNSWEFATLLRWISEGASNDVAVAKQLTRLDVTPTESVLIEPKKEIQLSALATFSDGSTRDVTAIAVYESANPIVKITSGGLVQSEQPGETTVLVRYLDQQIPVHLAFVPARPGFVWSDPKPNNYIDRFIFEKLLRLRMNPSEVCSDEVFVRRAWLDLCGIVPPADEATSFVLDPSPAKRRRLVNKLLERPEFADFWALKWCDVLRAEERILDRKGTESFRKWVRDGIAQHKPIDQFAREIIAARGSTYKNPAANFYRAARTPKERGEAAAELFLGRRVQCAQCHNHPFDRWSQDDYYDWQSVFARLDYKVLENHRRDSNDSHEFKGEQIVFLRSSAQVKNPRTGAAARPRFLGESSSWKSGGEDELTDLAKWVTSPENPFFARAQANRIWYHLFGRGIVEPLDDFRASNPPSHPELLDALARDLADHGFDLRQMIRTIMASRTYQLSSMPNETNGADEANFSHSFARRLSAEQLLDSQSEVLQEPAHFAGYPKGTRAVQLAAALSERKRDDKSGVDQFLATFGKPPRLLPSECERSCEPTMGQAFQMMNGPVLNEMLGASDNSLAELLKSKKSNEQIILSLYWSALTRPPKTDELKKFTSYLAEAKDRRAALEDIAWCLLNSKEFLFR
jgi:hypothetical protein